MSKLKKYPYLQINLIIAGVILLIMVYSGIFSANGVHHPIPSQAYKPVISTGLSRAFSEIVRLNFKQAIAFNPYSIKIFLLFTIQLFLRLGFSLMLLSIPNKQKHLIYTDIFLSVLLFLWAFLKFVIQMFNT